MSWLQTGAQSAALAKQEEQEAQKRKEEKGKMFRFFVKQKEEARITFVDGDLDANGHLNPPRFYEHGIKVAGAWTTYVCPEKTAPHLKDKCPLCAGGDRPALISLFTVIDHREVSSKDGTKTYKDTKKLLAMKPQAFELLLTKVKKFGALAGCTYDFGRVGDNSSSVGDSFDFIERREPAKLIAAYQKNIFDDKGVIIGKETNFTPANYDDEIVFRSGAELAALGFGNPAQYGGQTPAKTADSSGAYTPPSQQNYEGDPEQTDYSQQL